MLIMVLLCASFVWFILNTKWLHVPQCMQVESLLTVPKRKPRQLGLWSAAALAIGGLAFVAGVHHMRNR